MIYGRWSGSDYKYPRYSDKLAKSKILWTRERLKKFMMNPNSVIKGTKCLIENGKGVPREAEAWDIAEFLSRFTIANFMKMKAMVSVYSLEVKLSSNFSLKLAIYPSQIALNLPILIDLFRDHIIHTRNNISLITIINRA